MSQHGHDLARLPLFQQIPPRELAPLAKSSTVLQVARGHHFYDPRHVNQLLYILIEGQVTLYRINAVGKKITLTRLRDGAIFGEAALFAGDLPTHFAAATEQALVMAMPACDLTPLINKYPQISLQVLHTVSSRLYTLEEKLEEVAFKSLQARLIELLIQLAKEQGGNRITGYTHQDLAAELGTYRETATQLLNELRRQGYINLQRKQIQLLISPEARC